ncbi:MAG: FHA domain-containing protein [Chloroflexi bacterium]|nr:FHA domain-containing protein [Chloroflexota bacterium]
MRLWPLLLLPLLGVSLAAGLASAAAPLEAQLGPVDASGFPELAFNATVLDWAGLPLADLKPEAFEVREDGKRVQAEVRAVEDHQTELTVVLAVDTSGSMRGQPLEHAKQAVTTFVQQLGPADRFATIGFGSQACGVAVGHPVTSDRTLLQPALDGMRADGSSPVFDGAVEGLRLVSGLPPGRKALVLLTDGDNTCGKFTDTDVITIASRERVPVFTVGLGPDLKPGVLQRISEVTGGQYLEAANSSQLPELYKDLARRLRTRYALRYASQLLADRKEHLLEVLVSAAGTAGRAEQRFTPPPFSPDVEVNLAAGTRLEHPVELRPRLKTPVKLAKVEYLLDNTLLYTATESPFAYTLDPATLGAGSRTLKLGVADAFGGTSELEVPIEIAVPPPTLPEETPVSPPRPADVPGTSPLPAWLVIGAVLALPVLALAATQVRPGRRIRRCEVCGQELRPGWTVCPRHGEPAPAGVPLGSATTPHPVSSDYGQTASTPPIVAPEPAASGAAYAQAGATRLLRQEPVTLGWLVEKQGRRAGTQHRLGPGETIIGRDPDCDIVLDDAAASRRHAKVRQDAQDFVLTDLDTTNGTLVNGQSIVQHKLQLGDEVTIGETKLAFMHLEARREAP